MQKTLMMMKETNKANEQDAKTRGHWRERLTAVIRERFSLEEDKAPQSDVVEVINKSIEFRGINLWILIFATMIASLGLNINSVAVIIGAMLISPLMGPIIGMGFSLGTNDFQMLRRSFYNFSFMTIVALLTSTLYFLISPLGQAQSELLARTSPTMYDVLIAFFGGMAGMVAQSRRDRTSIVIPGVAIATALMPPLCTAGYGLATGQWNFFFGAFYLFVINTVFIAFATYVMMHFLRYHPLDVPTGAKERRVRHLMFAITLLTFIPSGIMGFHMVRVSAFESTADRFVTQVFQFERTRVIDVKKNYHPQRKVNSTVELLLVGEPLDESVVENARAQMLDFGLKNTDLIVRQANASDKVDLRTLQENYAELIEEKNAKIASLRAALSKHTLRSGDERDIAQEAAVVYDGVKAITLSKSITYDSEGKAVDTVLVCVVTPENGMAADTARLTDWLRVRTKIGKVMLFTENIED